jgi:hypothetical protein
LDTDGIIRSKERLQNETISDSAKVLFPKNTKNAIIISLLFTKKYFIVE